MCRTWTPSITRRAVTLFLHDLLSDTRAVSSSSSVVGIPFRRRRQKSNYFLFQNFPNSLLLPILLLQLLLPQRAGYSTFFFATPTNSRYSRTARFVSLCGVACAIVSLAFLGEGKLDWQKQTPNQTN